MAFRTIEGQTLWGMRGVPEQGVLGEGAALDFTKVVAFQLFLPQPARAHTLIVKGVRLVPKTGSANGVSLPFVNRFGQYMHADWPNKLKDEEELARRRTEEATVITDSSLPDRDAYGGWATGPQLEASGWFRTEKLNDKWWLVTPEGHLFLSIGVDVVGYWERTFVTGREDWFEWLPAADDPAFGFAYGESSGVHSMAEAIGGSGKTFSFYLANLVRKYGEDWANAWRDATCQRLRHWGFNTIGNWSQRDVTRDCRVPYVVSSDTRRAPVLEGSTGYWAKMVDPYTPAFATVANEAVAGLAREYAQDPYCIGFFIDNEIAWEGVWNGVLASPPEQPGRMAFIEKLQSRYGSIEALNTAWETEAASWDELRTPRRTNDASRADLEQLQYEFALQYFTVIDQAMQRRAPNHLYLGCRFALAPEQSVRAAGDVADVLSFNIYRPEVDCDRFAGVDKPFIIGEFHFGALDRGMFHTGLVPTENQDARAAAYTNYFTSMITCPQYVGAHWFQYIDEPITGRSYDGENYNIGLVDVTDTPYPELTKAAQEINRKAYELRYAEH
jgi:hypothetical protein